MSHRVVSLPVLPVIPRPPNEYDQGYMNQLLRALDALQRVVTGIGYLRGSDLFFVGLPTTGEDLIPGEVFSNGGILTMVQPDDIWVGTLSATGAVGTVTVVV